MEVCNLLFIQLVLSDNGSKLVGRWWIVVD